MLKGNGYKAIAIKLNHQGYKTKTGTHFNTSGVRYILMNPLYKGYIRSGLHVDWSAKRRKGKNDEYILVPGEHESIISEDDWNKAELLKG